MVEIVVPQCIESTTPARGWLDVDRVLGLVLPDEQEVSSTRSFAHGLTDGGEDVPVRFVEYLLRRIETKAVEVKLVDPVRSVGDEELADRAGVWPIEVDSVAPLVVVAGRKVGRRK